MPFDQESKNKKLLTRRDFLKKGGAAGVAVGAASVLPAIAGKALAARRNYILIGHPNPSTGALAEFGLVSPWADERAIAAVNSQGGIYVGEYGKRLPVRVKVVDTQSDPVKARKLGEQLIVILFCLHVTIDGYMQNVLCENTLLYCFKYK